MAAFNGIGSALGLGEESTYGTAVSRTNWVKLAAIPRASVTKNYVENPILPDQPTKEQPVNVRDGFEGSFRTAAAYDGQGMIWKHALGTTDATTGSGPYTHTYKLASTLPTGLTAEFKRGNATNAEVAEGCKINRLRFSCQTDQYALIECDVLGETSTSSAVGTPSYTATRTRITAAQAGDFSWNSGTYCLNSIEFTVENNLSVPTMMGCAREPIRDFARVTGRIVVEYDGENWRNGLANETVSDGSVTFTSGTSTFTPTFENMVITNVSRPVNDGGRIMQTIDFQCYGDGSKTGLKVVIVNDSSGNTDN